MLQNRGLLELTGYAVKFQYDGIEQYLDESKVYWAANRTVRGFIEYCEESTGLELPRYQRGDPRPVREKQEESKRHTS